MGKLNKAQVIVVLDEFLKQFEIKNNDIFVVGEAAMTLLGVKDSCNNIEVVVGFIAAHALVVKGTDVAYCIQVQALVCQYGVIGVKVDWDTFKEKDKQRDPQYSRYPVMSAQHMLANTADNEVVTRAALQNFINSSGVQT